MALLDCQIVDACLSCAIEDENSVIGQLPLASGRVRPSKTFFKVRHYPPDSRQLVGIGVPHAPLWGSCRGRFCDVAQQTDEDNANKDVEAARCEHCRPPERARESESPTTHYRT